MSINLSLAGFLLTLYRQVGAFAPTNVDRKIMRYAMQDAARQTASGGKASRQAMTGREHGERLAHEAA